MAKVIGNPTTTPNPQSDLMQTDSTKADYVKGKEQFIEEIKKVMPSQSVGIEKTVSGGIGKDVSIKDFIIATIKIKTIAPNTNVIIIIYDENHSPDAYGIFTDENGEYEYLPPENAHHITFYCGSCDFAVTYQVDINAVIEQVDKNTEDVDALSEKVEQNTQDIADLKENTNRSLFANALKGTASGVVIELRDISPIEHLLEVEIIDADPAVDYSSFVLYTSNGNEIKQYKPNTDGTFEGVKSQLPYTNLFTSHSLNMKVTYNRDINKAIGDFETALDNAIALCDTYINWRTNKTNSDGGTE